MLCGPDLVFVIAEYLIPCKDVLIFVAHWSVNKHLSCGFFFFCGAVMDIEAAANAPNHALKRMLFCFSKVNIQKWDCWAT